MSSRNRHRLVRNGEAVSVARISTLELFGVGQTGIGLRVDSSQSMVSPRARCGTWSVSPSARLAPLSQRCRDLRESGGSHDQHAAVHGCPACPIGAKENVNPPQTGRAFSSSGCSVRNDNPIVRLRWTDRDLVSLAANEEVVLADPPQRSPSETASAVRQPGSAAVARHQSPSPLRSLSKRRGTVEPPVILRWFSKGQVAT
jgi:hypothetical protein